MRGQLGGIIEAIEADAPDLVAKLNEADRAAKVRHQQWLVEEEQRRREEDRRRIEQSVADSKLELGKIIEQWSDVIGVERFLAGVEHRAADLAEGEQSPLLERLALARAFLGSQDPLDFFRTWKTPEERNIPKYKSQKAGEGG